MEQIETTDQIIAIRGDNSSEPVTFEHKLDEGISNVALRSLIRHGHKLTAYQQAVKYEATNIGVSHECTGRVLHVATVSRIIRRVKKQLGRLTPAKQRELLYSWSLGYAHIDALMIVSRKRNLGLIED